MSYRETIAFHAREFEHGAFERELANAVELASDDGYEVVGISHSVSTSWGETNDLTVYSAVVWAQRIVSDEDGEA